EAPGEQRWNCSRPDWREEANKTERTRLLLHKIRHDLDREQECCSASQKEEHALTEKFLREQNDTVHNISCLADIRFNRHASTFRLVGHRLQEIVGLFNRLQARPLRPLRIFERNESQWNERGLPTVHELHSIHQGSQIDAFCKRQQETRVLHRFHLLSRSSQTLPGE